jgi:hypothetical protein
MNIKSLLLGSAAALVVVSGAQAADAVVAAEPEPMEYVKVCDAYGTGYFYIPGTETCLKVGGRVRFDVMSANSYKAESAKGWNTNTRMELYVNSASDTEYGALKTSITARQEFAGTYNDGTHTTTKLMVGTISLAGFSVGLADSVFTTFTYYSTDVANDDVIRYGPKEINQISYLYDNGSGVRATVSLQDDRGAMRGYTDKSGVFHAFTSSGGTQLYDNGHDYAPDVIGGVGYTAGAFAFNVIGGYDESTEEGAVKGRIDGNFGPLSAFAMVAWSSSGDKTNAFAPGDDYSAWGDWAAWGGVSYKYSDSVKFNTQISGTDNDTLALAANVKWNPVKDLVVQPEVTYTRWDKIDKDQWNGMVRFQRTF